MNTTYTHAQISALVAAGIDLNEFFALGETAPTQAPVTQPTADPAEKPATQAPAPKVLTRARWKALRTTKSGSVRKAFVGLTREQAFERGLCEGYVLPTGAMRESLGA